MNRDVSIGPLTPLLACSLASLTHSLAARCSHLFVCLLAPSLTPKIVEQCIIRCLIMTWFCPIVDGQVRVTISHEHEKPRRKVESEMDGNHDD